MSIWTRIYQHSNFGGSSTFGSLAQTTPPTTYLRISKDWLSNANLHDRASSLRLGASSSERGGRVILFQHHHFSGRYVMFETAGGASNDVPSLPALNFNDITSSALIVRRARRECGPLALGSLGRPNLRQRMVSQVNAIDSLSSRGTPIITWSLWPSFDPSRKFIYLRIPVTVDVPNWFDYDAEIRFWIYLYINSSNKVRGYVAYYGCWVEGGILTGKIKDRLMSEIPGSIGDVNDSVNDALDALEAFDFTGLYYLPGMAGSSGHIHDDCSIVLIKEW